MSIKRFLIVLELYTKHLRNIEEPDLLIYKPDYSQIRFAESKRLDTRDKLRETQVRGLVLLSMLLAGSLGNLLPLAQSIHSSLQNDSFDDKKISTAKGHRGYENGSHSEIEVSKEVA